MADSKTHTHTQWHTCTHPTQRRAHRDTHNHNFPPMKMSDLAFNPLNLATDFQLLQRPAMTPWEHFLITWASKSLFRNKSKAHMQDDWLHVIVYDRARRVSLHCLWWWWWWWWSPSLSSSPSGTLAYSGGLFGRLIREAYSGRCLIRGAYSGEFPYSGSLFGWGLLFGELIRSYSGLFGGLFGPIRGVTRAESWVIRAASWSSGAYFGHRPLLRSPLGLRLLVRQAGRQAGRHAGGAWGRNLVLMYLFLRSFLKHQERTGKDKLGATRSLKNPQILLSPSLVLSESLDLFVTPSSLHLSFVSMIRSLFFVTLSLSPSLPLLLRLSAPVSSWALCFMDCGSIQNLESPRCSRWSLDPSAHPLWSPTISNHLSPQRSRVCWQFPSGIPSWPFGIVFC